MTVFNRAVLKLSVVGNYSIPLCNADTLLNFYHLLLDAMSQKNIEPWKDDLLP